MIQIKRRILKNPPFCDLGRIQTCNLLSRNQVHYSVMLRGLFYYKAKILIKNIKPTFNFSYRIISNNYKIIRPRRESISCSYIFTPPIILSNYDLGIKFEHEYLCAHWRQALHPNARTIELCWNGVVGSSKAKSGNPFCIGDVETGSHAVATKTVCKTWWFE